MQKAKQSIGKGKEEKSGEEGEEGGRKNKKKLYRSQLLPPGDPADGPRKGRGGCRTRPVADRERPLPQRAGSEGTKRSADEGEGTLEPVTNFGCGCEGEWRSVPL